MSPKILTPDYKILRSQFNVRLDPDVKAAFFKKCIAAQVKPATVIRNLIDEFLSPPDLTSGDSVLHCPNEEKESVDTNKIVNTNGGTPNGRAEDQSPIEGGAV